MTFRLSGNKDGQQVVTNNDLVSEFGPIKPCPFCFFGRPNLVITRRPYLTCPSCGTEGPVYYPDKFMPPEHCAHILIKLWNKRPAEEQAIGNYLSRRWRKRGDDMTGGYLYGEKEPTEKCPYCGTECHADFVDIGVGFQQCGPYHCDNCFASEIGPYDEPRSLTTEEEAKGWYAPDSEPGSSANVIHGRIVNHTEMKAAYDTAFNVNNPVLKPLLERPGFDVGPMVEKWKQEIRKK